MTEKTPEAEKALPTEEAITLATLNLFAAVDALLEAGQAYAELPLTEPFLMGDGYRLQFAGNELLSLTRS